MAPLNIATPHRDQSTRAALGITVRDTTPTPAPAPTTRPVVTVDSGQRLLQVIHFSDEVSPTRKAKPKGAMGAEVWVKVGDPAPVDESELTFLALDTRTPYTAKYVGADANKVAPLHAPLGEHPRPEGPVERNRQRHDRGVAKSLPVLKGTPEMDDVICNSCAQSYVGPAPADGLCVSCGFPIAGNMGQPTPVPRKTIGLASLWVGIAAVLIGPLTFGFAIRALRPGSFFFPFFPPLAQGAFGVIALGLGIAAIVRAMRNPSLYRRKSYAIAGICFSVVALVLSAGALGAVVRVRELDRRLIGAARLQKIYQACALYAEENRGSYPPSLAQLSDWGEFVASDFQNPSAGSKAGKFDYYYIVGLANSDDSNWPLAYGDKSHHNDEGANVLYRDGTVKFIKEPQLSEVLRKFRADYERKRGHAARVLPPT